MSKVDSGSELLKLLRTLLVGGVLGATGVMALLLFGPQWFRVLFLAMQPQSTPSPVAVITSPASSDAQSGSPLPGASPATQVVQVAFEDIKGSFGEKEITQLAQLGVFDTTTGKFNPTQPITRAEFLRWLVRANNAIWFDQPDKMVREAEGGPATFADVPPTHPDFRYIQGVANAGIAVGYDEKSFKPDQPLSREQMIAIKIGLDKGGFEKLEGFPGLAIPEIQANKLGGLVPAWTDRSQISTRFISAFNNEYYSHDSSLRNFIKNIDYFKNVDRTFGVIKALRPQAPVTRAEAAICVSLIGNHLTADASTEKIGFRTVEQALQLKVGKSAPNSQ